MNRILAATAAITLWGGACTVLAEEAPTSPGTYYSAMGHYLSGLDSGQINDGYGGGLGVGWSYGRWAIEVNALYTELSTSSRGEGSNFVPATSASYVAGGLNALVFPLQSLPGLYGLVGAGGIQISKYPTRPAADLGAMTLQTGLGYLFDMGRFSIRTEALVRYANRFDEIPRIQPDNSYADIDVPKTFTDLILNVGVQIPLSKPVPLPPPTPTAVAVVEPVAPPDSDGDGVEDAVDQCPGTAAGVKVDPNGCPLAPPPPPCKTPEPGERISLGGCGTGEVIVLRGVTFAFDSAELEPNARVILDNVADELRAYPEIKVELSGHTDSRGSDEYNQSLSDRRASSVLAYLSEVGIDASRMTSIGRGEAQPVADNDTDEGRQINRRVELTITSGVTSTSRGGAVAEPAEGTAPPPVDGMGGTTTPPVAGAEPAQAPTEGAAQTLPEG